MFLAMESIDPRPGSFFFCSLESLHQFLSRDAIKKIRDRGSIDSIAGLHDSYMGVKLDVNVKIVYFLMHEVKTHNFLFDFGPGSVAIGPFLGKLWPLY
jgi:hypothetical protein